MGDRTPRANLEPLAERPCAVGELAEHIVKARALWVPRAFGAGDATLAELATGTNPKTHRAARRTSQTP